MDKLQMAHDWYMKHADGANTHMDLEIGLAWRYADAMQAEAEKRESKERPDVLKEEWQPDWSQAPEWAEWWAMDADSDCYWFKNKPTMRSVTWSPNDPTQVNETQSFGYTGNWQNSLRKRPEALCKVDWSVAPLSAHAWQMVEGCAVWINSHGTMGYAPTFGFTGSHIMERPQ